ncbi:ABC transporter substrate-binding protein [Paenibacillus sp. HW567]|uniref:ABC transporter substrate-binding protein n=1 Tax=Paenibacillus sp. HW567 TaxID=1034769 RepID=UPI000362C225|nr:ABC transporter substrate-binding protein [Paenibacillus sp. HW567]
MKSKKGISPLLLSTVLIGSLLSACSSNSGTSTADSKNAAADAKVAEIVFALPSFNRIPDDLSKVTNAINEITTKKIGVKVDFRLYGPSDYAQKVNLALQSGEKMDIFTTLGQFSNYVSKNQLAPLDDLLPKYGKEMNAILEKDFGPDILKTTTMDGHIYGIPVNKGMAVPTNIIYNTDMLKEAGVTADRIQSVNDLPAVFADVKTKFPDVVPFGPISVNPTDTGLINLLKGSNKVDYLTDTTGVGVVIGDSGKVVNYYESDVFKNGIKMMRDWFNAGYLQKDTATTTITGMEMISSGRGFSYLGGYSGKEVGTMLSAQAGKELQTKRIAPFYFDTSAVNAVTWMVSSTSKEQEAAVKFLNLLYSDADLINTILFGIEGEDYLKVDEHHVKLPEGKDANTVPYTAMLSSGIVGSESLQYQLEGTNWSDVELKLKENKDTERSPYFGFIFDQSEVKTQISAVNNVVNQFLPALVSGSVDPDTIIPKFISALKDAGAQAIIDSKQKQLDQWIAAKNQ